jgi:hypothetical protein
MSVNGTGSTSVYYTQHAKRGSLDRGAHGYLIMAVKTERIFLSSPRLLRIIRSCIVCIRAMSVTTCRRPGTRVGWLQVEVVTRTRLGM